MLFNQLGSTLDDSKPSSRFALEQLFDDRDRLLEKNENKSIQSTVHETGLVPPSKNEMETKWFHA